MDVSLVTLKALSGCLTWLTASPPVRWAWSLFGLLVTTWETHLKMTSGGKKRRIYLYLKLKTTGQGQTSGMAVPGYRSAQPSQDACVHRWTDLYGLGRRCCDCTYSAPSWDSNHVNCGRTRECTKKRRYYHQKGEQAGWAPLNDSPIVYSCGRKWRVTGRKWLVQALDCWSLAIVIVIIIIITTITIISFSGFYEECITVSGT